MCRKVGRKTGCRRHYRAINRRSDVDAEPTTQWRCLVPNIPKDAAVHPAPLQLLRKIIGGVGTAAIRAWDMRTDLRRVFDVVPAADRGGVGRSGVDVLFRDTE